MADIEQVASDSERIAAAPPERVVSGMVMALVAVVGNVVRPSHEEIKTHIERSRDPYFRAFLHHCMMRVYGRR